VLASREKERRKTCRTNVPVLLCGDDDKGKEYGCPMDALPFALQGGAFCSGGIRRKGPTDF